MPYIETKTTLKVSREQEMRLKDELGRAIALIPGKSEEWLMLNLIDECRMAFRGECEPDIAMVEIDVFGKASSDAYDALTERVCEVINAELGIKKDRIYVKYRECDRWGYNGFNF